LTSETLKILVKKLSLLLDRWPDREARIIIQDEVGYAVLFRDKVVVWRNLYELELNGEFNEIARDQEMARKHMEIANRAWTVVNKFLAMKDYYD